MDNNNRGDLARFGNNGNAELDSKVSIVDLFAETFKTIFFIIPVTRKVLEFILGLFIDKRK